MKASLYFATVLVSLLLGASGCGVKSSNSTPADAKVDAVQESDLQIVPSEGDVIAKTLTEKIDKLVSQTNYTELEQLADSLRKSKVQTARGTWHLDAFYRVLSLDSEMVGCPPDDVWKARLSFLKSWTNAMPASITARLALAGCYIEYAWNARGNGTAETVSPANFALFEERLKQASRILQTAKKFEAKCPVWWEMMLRIALGLGWDASSYNKLFDEAVAFEPAYVTYYNHKVLYLLPRWYGQEGDAHKFVVEAADKMGGDRGDILYAQIGWGVHERGVYSGFLRDSGFEWPRLKKGFEGIIKEHPDSLTAANELAYLAYQADDQACAKPLFQRLGTKLDSQVWRDDKARFLRARTWALSQ